MDMWEPYEQEVRHQCPAARIVYDLFHVKSKYAREVVDRVRIDEANKYSHDKSGREIIKGSKWLLLRNKENLVHNNKAMVYSIRREPKRIHHHKTSSSDPVVE